jgi:photosystem II stability/assembly factor-like uncharacterized protein
MTTLRSAVSAVLLLGAGWTAIGRAEVRQIAPPVEDSGLRVETTETRDVAGNRYETEIRTDAEGRRTRLVRMLDARAGHGSGPSLDATSEPDPEPIASAGWSSLGPSGGDIRELAVSPSDSRIILAGLVESFSASNRYEALYRSADGGETWQPVLNVDRIPNPHFVELGVYGLEFAANGDAYAATTNGLWRSVDSGVTWSLVTDRNWDVRAITFEPGTSDHLWIGLATGAIYRSPNAGANWQSLRTPTEELECRAIAFDSARPGVVAACFGYDYAYPNRTGSVYLSMNNGTTWLDRTGDLPNAAVNDIAFRNGGLYVGAGNDWVGPFAGVYVSIDDGVRWSGQNAHWPFQSRSIRDLEFDPSNPCVIWAASTAGVFRSTDCGTNWSFFIGHSRHNVRVIRLVGTDQVLAGSEFGFLKRQGAGDFLITGRGIPHLNASRVVQNPRNPNELAVSFLGWNSGGVYSTLDRGAHWTLENVLRARITDVAFDRNGVLYAVTDGPTFINADGVHRREVNGTWTYLGPDEGPFAETDLFWFEISPSDPNFMMVGGGDFSNGGFAYSFWRTIDGGLHWQKVVRETSTISFFPGGGTIVESGTTRTLIAAMTTDEDRAILRSVDNGTTWSHVTNGLPFGLSAGSIASSGSHVYLSAPYRSDDAGATWSRVTRTGPFNPSVIECDPTSPRTLYAIDRTLPPYGTVVRSIDGGASFTSIHETPVGQAYALTLGAGTCPELFAASANAGWARDAAPPPTLTARSNVTRLWPPNHQMVDVHFDVAVTDACDPTAHFVLAGIACDEPGSAGDIEDATIGSPDTDFRLRAKRSGTNVSRIYSITYRAISSSGTTDIVRTIEVPRDIAVVPTDGAPEENASNAGTLPLVTALTGVSPSPFRASTTVSFDLATPRTVRVRVLDLRGAVVRTLVDGVQPAGRHRIDWDGRDGSGHALANGVYWVSFDGANVPQSRRIVMLR